MGLDLALRLSRVIPTCVGGNTEELFYGWTFSKSQRVCRTKQGVKGLEVSKPKRCLYYNKAIRAARENQDFNTGKL